MESRKQIGKILVDAGIISDKTLERALKIQKVSCKRLGELLREMGIVTDEEVADALACQLNLKTVRNFADHAFPQDLLDLVSTQMALEKLIFPLKYHDRTLAIATLDPFDHETFTQLAQKTGMRIYLVLSTREDIIAAVEKHYLMREKVTSYKQKILLIDDSPVFAKVLGTALTKEGYEVLFAGDGIEGLKLALSHHPNLILCDLFMPRMDGYNFMLAMKEYREIAKIPVILVTSKASMEEEDQALKAGFIDFIGKPVLPARVIARVQRALATHENNHQKKMSSPVSADLQPALFASKAACRASLQRREFVSRFENKFQRSSPQ
jgi:CheY-like chemotaxis protein